MVLPVDALSRIPIKVVKTLVFCHRFMYAFLGFLAVFFVLFLRVFLLFFADISRVFAVF
jgi:hypothetical protein